MVSMMRPSRGLRSSATTTRYVGCFFLPTRMRRIFTDTTGRPPVLRRSLAAGIPVGALQVARSAAGARDEGSSLLNGRETRHSREAAELLGGHARWQLHAAAPSALPLLPRLRERPHHLLHHLELLQQRVDLRRRRPAPRRDARPTRAV